ncbi:uncharacterized protein KY384_004113 [Bacidia gigantensis]|uniref:uncharacterized protein n=1 Tax=Bacidia gigantensis TaxID=2732470 RepID=UPI001D0414BE|nr:uncharacterized protein KY384_004113 [Bacidia gigantensis]KAG8530756.1 hypothetical protein KY384_004113 [Bacidia gigantensis]
MAQHSDPQSDVHPLNHLSSSKVLLIPDRTSTLTPDTPPGAPPDFSARSSYISTPSSTLSLDDNSRSGEDEICFPSYDDNNFLDQEDSFDPEDCLEDLSLTPLTRSPKAEVYTPPTEPQQPAGDDMAIRTEPTRQVDYLSHVWKEEDLWASWRHIRLRKNLYNQSERLENASWRSWAMIKHKLKLIPADSLDWLKDHDVTWLYGPLQTRSTPFLPSSLSYTTGQLCRSNSFTSKKPILKKRSLSEIMLQRSLSSSTLMQQATDALRSQQSERTTSKKPVLGERKVSDFISISGSETPLTRTITMPSSSNASTSTSTSGDQTPSMRRHIHFNDRVEQCIAINCDHEDHAGPDVPFDDSDESSEDEFLTMQPVQTSTKAKISRPSTPRNSFSSESKTIAMLPSTTLKNRSDTPELGIQQLANKRPVWPTRPKISPSPSLQTIRPSSPSANFLLADEDDDIDFDWQPSAGRRGSVFPRGGLEIKPEDHEDEPESYDPSLRRTPSGMFMPYDDQDDYPRDGILGRIVDTVNTARDIAHVIWNVGWQR